MSSPTPPPVAASTGAPRLVSIDAYRGAVMLLMMGELLRFRKVAAALPDNPVWNLLAYHQSHVDWVGASLHDLIQPSFSFLAGVALPFSLAARRARGESPGRMALHAWGRALLLVLLGIFLRSASRTSTYWTFEDTLTQIGLGYGVLFLVALRPVRDQWIAFGAILVATFAAFAAWPLPGAGFDFGKVGVSAAWLASHGLEGFAAHWQKNSNLAWAFDTWWLNLFPREKPFTAHPGGYATLSFVPTLATMILGLVAGQVLRSGRDSRAQVRWLALAGAGALAAGLLLGWSGLVPVVKRIWTPSWVLFSGGWCLLLLALFHLVTEVAGRRTWCFPLLVVGANSIAAYVLAHGFDAYVERTLLIHLGPAPFQVLGPALQPLLSGAATLAVLWLILWWMYRRRLFLKV